MTTVVALGGNALIRAGDRGTAAEQSARLRQTAEALAPLLGRGDLVVTHGNGPQVGNELLRQERSADEVPPLPLYLAVAQTQAEIGSMIETELGPAAGRPVTCLLTHVVVAKDDPAFERPTKPIGPFYSSEQARALEAERGWQLVEELGRGWRRTVPSPTPLEVVELDGIRALLATGAVPVDKDRASAVLAANLGGERLVILTDVPAVKRGFGTPAEEEIRELTPEQAEKLLVDLAEGSMRPKVEAAIAMARSGGQAIITSLDGVDEALRGEAGTRIGP